MWVLSDFHLELTKWNDCDETISRSSHRAEVLLSDTEVSSVHLSDHATDRQRFQIRILECNECATVNYNAKEINVVILLCDLVSSKHTQVG